MKGSKNLSLVQMTMEAVCILLGKTDWDTAVEGAVARRLHLAVRVRQG